MGKATTFRYIDYKESTLKKLILLLLSTIILSAACVTTAPTMTEEKAAPPPAPKEEPPKKEKEEPQSAPPPEPAPEESQGIIYSTKALTDGPHLLGSKEHMTGPIMEFSLLFSTYFPMSVVEPPLSFYQEGKGTRWVVRSKKLEEEVYFERALLSYDDEEKSWWFFKVEGDGFSRQYEFLVNENWQLLEMRYRTGNSIESFVPTVDSESDMRRGLDHIQDMEISKEELVTELGVFETEHLFSAGREYWTSDEITGRYLKSLIKKEGEIFLEAVLVEEKDGYSTVMESYRGD